MIKQYVGSLKLRRGTINAKYFKAETLLEFTSYARLHNFKDNCFSAYYQKPSFYGTASFDDCLSFSIVTSREQKKLESLLKEKVESFEASLPESRFEVSGNELDVGRVMGGEPECFFEDFEEVKPAKKALVKVNMTILWNTRKSDITNRAVTIMALVEWLKRHDISVAVELFQFGEYIDSDMATSEYEGEYIGVGPLYDPPKKLLFNAFTGEFYRRVFHAYSDYFCATDHAVIACEDWHVGEEDRKAYDLVFCFHGRFNKWQLGYDYERVVSGGELEPVTYLG